MNPSVEKVHPALLPAKEGSRRPQKFSSSTHSITINTWSRDFKKWISVIEKWRLEAGLMNRLMTKALIGQERHGKKLQELQESLTAFVHKDVNELEKRILDMQRDLDLLQRFLISSEEVKEGKIEMRSLSNIYAIIKNNILKELTAVYPLRIY